MRDSNLVIGTRGSPLALWQANWVKGQLETVGYSVEIRIIKTSGDRFSADELPPASVAQTVAQAGTKGLFIKEIEEALLEGEVDVAVHSLKDLPAEQPAGLRVAAVPKREDARDVLVSKGSISMADLPARSRVGTSSLRRQTQLRALRPDLQLKALRGNLDTRLRKLDRGECDALVVAAAGVHRLGLEARITAYFEPDQICPAPGQGALAIEIREPDDQAARAVTPFDDLPTHRAVRAERAMLRRLGGGCQVPIAAHAVVEGPQLRLRGVVADPQGQKVIRATASGALEDPEGLGSSLAEELFAQGAQAILAAL